MLGFGPVMHGMFGSGTSMHGKAMLGSARSCSVGRGWVSLSTVAYGCVRRGSVGNICPEAWLLARGSIPRLDASIGHGTAWLRKAMSGRVEQGAVR